jgi:hypothetical protein
MPGSPLAISCRRRPKRSDSVKLLLAWYGFLLIAAATAVSAQPAAEAETAIRNALSRWTSDFNARDAAHICDLFAKDLLYDYRGFPERDYESLRSLLRRSVANQTKKFAYSLDIKGDHRRGRSRSGSPCLDAQSDGRWRSERGGIERARARCVSPPSGRQLEDRPLCRLRGAMRPFRRWGLRRPAGCSAAGRALAGHAANAGWIR